MRRPFVYFALFVALMIGLTGCASQYTSATYGDPYGFWYGVWHGLIAPFALIAVLLSWLASIAGVSFLSNVSIIGFPNTGLSYYYVGFVLGLLMSLDGTYYTAR